MLWEEIPGVAAEACPALEHQALARLALEQQALARQEMGYLS